MIDGPPEPGGQNQDLVGQEPRRSAVASSGSPEKHRWGEVEGKGREEVKEKRRGVEMKDLDSD